MCKPKQILTRVDEASKEQSVQKHQSYSHFKCHILVLEQIYIRITNSKHALTMTSVQSVMSFNHVIQPPNPMPIRDAPTVCK